MLKVPDFIVSCEWLYEHLDHQDLIVLDATIPKVTNTHQESFSKDSIIPGALFFDIKKTFSDQDAQFPNAMISKELFH